MAEPDGYRAANDLRARRGGGAPADVLTPFCRVDPHDGAVAEATRALDAGARGIKLHPRAERLHARRASGRASSVALARRAPAADPDPRWARHPGARAATRSSSLTRHPDARRDPGPRRRSRTSPGCGARCPSIPNLFIDTVVVEPRRHDHACSAWCRLVGSLWASDSPYGQPLSSAVMHLRYAVEAGLGAEAIRSIAGASDRAAFSTATNR